MDFDRPSRIDVLVHTLAAHWLMRRSYRRFAESLGLEGDEQVLDFGSGSGALGEHIAEILLQGTGRVTCVDTSRAWTDIAKKKLRKYPNVEFLVGDISALDIDEASFDVITIHLMLHDVERGRRQAAVQALARALKPGGRLVVREPTKEGHGISAREIRELMAAAGLTEASSAAGRLFMMGRTYTGVFRKQAE